MLSSASPAVEVKAKAIKSIMRRNVVTRSIQDIDELTISASEAKALASGNPDVLKTVTLKNDIARLQLVQASHRDSIVRARGELTSLPMIIMEQQEALADLVNDKTLADKTQEADFAMTLGNSNFNERSKAGEALDSILPAIEVALPPPAGGIMAPTINALGLHNCKSGRPSLSLSPYWLMGRW